MSAVCASVAFRTSFFKKKKGKSKENCNKNPMGTERNFPFRSHCIQWERFYRFSSLIKIFVETPWNQYLNGIRREIYRRKDRLPKKKNYTVLHQWMWMYLLMRNLAKKFEFCRYARRGLGSILSMGFFPSYFFNYFYQFSIRS